MKIATISVEGMWKMVNAAVAGFDANPDPAGKIPTQLAMEDAIATARREGELDLALSLVCIHCARMRGPADLRAALTTLLEREFESRSANLIIRPRRPSMTTREEIADIFGRLGDHFHRLAVLYQPPPAPPGGKVPPPPIPATRDQPPAAHQVHEEPANVQAGDDGMDGRAYYLDIKGDQATLRRVQAIGKSIGYGWQVSGWTPEMVADVRRRLEAKMPGGPVRRAAR